MLDGKLCKVTALIRTHVIDLLILYLLSLLQTRKSYPAIQSSLFVIKYFHKIVVHHDPCNSELVNCVLEGIKRICCRTARKKKPFSPQLLNTLYKSLGKDNMNLINLRTMLLSVLSFMGFLRFSEVINLKCLNITLKGTLMSIFVENKKLMYTEKPTGCIYPNYSLLLFKKYIEAAKIKESEEKFIFRQICHSKQGFKLKDLDKPISYTTVRDILLTNLKIIGLDKTQFGLHSLKSGVTTAAANFGINDRIFQKHERWKSKNVKNGYVYENLRSLLSVSTNFGP